MASTRVYVVAALAAVVCALPDTSPDAHELQVATGSAGSPEDASHQLDTCEDVSALTKSNARFCGWVGLGLPDLAAKEEACNSGYILWRGNVVTCQWQTNPYGAPRCKVGTRTGKPPCSAALPCTSRTDKDTCMEDCADPKDGSFVMLNMGASVAIYTRCGVRGRNYPSGTPSTQKCGWTNIHRTTEGLKDECWCEDQMC